MNSCAEPQPSAGGDREEAARLESRAATLGTLMGTLQKDLDAEAAGRRSDRAHLVRPRKALSAAPPTQAVHPVAKLTLPLQDPRCCSPGSESTCWRVQHASGGLAIDAPADHLFLPISVTQRLERPAYDARAYRAREHAHGTW